MTDANEVELMAEEVVAELELTEELPWTYTLPARFNVRPEQDELAERIFQLFLDGAQVVILQAPVGWGKSLLAELVRQKLARWKQVWAGQGQGDAGGEGSEVSGQGGMGMVYLAPYLQLQEQFQESFPAAEVLMGKSHYPTPFEPEATCADCRDRVFCKYEGEDVGCEYRLCRRVFCEADVGVTNVAYWLRAANHQRMFRAKVMGPDEVSRNQSHAWVGDFLTVFDEVDRVEDITLGFIRVEVVLDGLKELAKMAKDVLRVPVVVPKAPVRDQEGWMIWWHDALKVAKLVHKAAKKLWGDERSIAHSRLLKKAEGMVQKLERVNGDWVYNLQREMKGNRRTGGAEKVVLEPVKVGDMGQEMIWNHVGRALLMSGTVGSRQVLEDEVGLTNTGIRTEYIEVDSPWDWRRRPVFQMPGVEVTKEFRGLPWSEQPCFKGLVDHAKFVLERAWGEDDGSRAIIHTVSHELACELGEALEELYGRRVIAQRTGMQKEQCLNKYTRNRGTVLLSASIARGVDLPYDLCRDNLVAKVPWGNLGDKRIMKRKNEGPMGKMWYEVQTLREILQMLGRGMRGADDWQRGWIMDAQFRKLASVRGLVPVYFERALQPLGSYIMPVNMRDFG